LEFSTFNPKIFRFFKFRAENFSARELSARKNLAGKIFRPAVPGAIGRAGIGGGWCVPSVECVLARVFPGFDVIGREFSGSKTFERRNFPRENFLEGGHTHFLKRAGPQEQR
jgi:hypothetical protein